MSKKNIELKTKKKKRVNLVIFSIIIICGFALFDKMEKEFSSQSRKQTAKVKIKEKKIKRTQAKEPKREIAKTISNKDEKHVKFVSFDKLFKWEGKSEEYKNKDAAKNFLFASMYFNGVNRGEMLDVTMTALLSRGSGSVKYISDIVKQTDLSNLNARSSAYQALGEIGYRLSQESKGSKNLQALTEIRDLLYEQLEAPDTVPYEASSILSEEQIEHELHLGNAVRINGDIFINTFESKSAAINAIIDIGDKESLDQLEKYKEDKLFSSFYSQIDQGITQLSYELTARR